MDHAVIMTQGNDQSIGSARLDMDKMLLGSCDTNQDNESGTEIIKPDDDEEEKDSQTHDSKDGKKQDMALQSRNEKNEKADVKVQDVNIDDIANKVELK